jgi:hypothetical protein
MKTRRATRYACAAAAVIVASIVVVLFGSTPTNWAAPAQPLSVVKECSAFTGTVGGYCTIAQRTAGPIPVGTRVYYYGPVLFEPPSNAARGPEPLSAPRAHLKRSPVPSIPRAASRRLR